MISQFKWKRDVIFGLRKISSMTVFFSFSFFQFSGIFAWLIHCPVKKARGRWNYITHSLNCTVRMFYSNTRFDDFVDFFLVCCRRFCCLQTKICWNRTVRGEPPHTNRSDRRKRHVPSPRVFHPYAMLCWMFCLSCAIQVCVRMCDATVQCFKVTMWL